MKSISDFDETQMIMSSLLAFIIINSHSSSVIIDSSPRLKSSEQVDTPAGAPGGLPQSKMPMLQPTLSPVWGERKKMRALSSRSKYS